MLATVCSCMTGYLYTLITGTTHECILICGDGLVIPPETCDDGGLGGCNSACSGNNTNFNCSGGSTASPSICVCDIGYKLNTPTSYTCLTNCGDGLVYFPETCDDGGLGGCD